jgi:hypothetical protein
MTFTMKTVPSNRTKPVLDAIVAVKAYTLNNYFKGAAVNDIPALLAYIARMGSGKVRYDKLSGRGQIKLHSNEWYEFYTWVGSEP